MNDSDMDALLRTLGDDPEEGPRSQPIQGYRGWQGTQLVEDGHAGGHAGDRAGGHAGDCADDCADGRAGDHDERTNDVYYIAKDLESSLASVDDTTIAIRDRVGEIAEDLKAVQDELVSQRGEHERLTELREELTLAKNALMDVLDSGDLPRARESIAAARESVAAAREDAVATEVRATREALVVNQERLETILATVVGLSEEMRETRVAVEELRHQFSVVSATLLAHFQAREVKPWRRTAEPAPTNAPVWATGESGSREEKQPPPAPAP